MFILYGWDTITKQENLLGKKQCENCGNVTDIYLARLIFRIKLFFIPVLWWTTKRFILCSRCGIVKEIDKNEYNELKNNPGMIYSYNIQENSNKEIGRIQNWQDNITDGQTYMNYNENISNQSLNQYSNRGLAILLKFILSPIVTFIIWFLYVLIVAIVIPAEAEITDTQIGVSLLLAIITTIIIMVKIKPNKKK